MLLFALSNPQSPESSAACLFGPDHVCLHADIRAQNGVLRCEKGVRGAAGLGLQFPVTAPEGLLKGGEGDPPADLGRLVLTTTLLPERNEPYLLSLELARNRVMMLLHDLEECGFFDLPPNDPIVLQVERARKAFTEAMVCQRSGDRPGPGGYSATADELSRLAIALSLDVGEKVALRHARRQLEGRLSGRIYKKSHRHAARLNGVELPPNAVVKASEGDGVVVPGAPTIGCAVDTGRFDDPALKALAAADFVSVPLRWVELEPQEGTYSFQRTDRWIEWAVRTAKLPVVAGPIVDFRRDSIPDWLAIWENDYETLRELVYEHVRHIVTRYRRTVSRWTLVSGVQTNDNFRLTFEQMVDLTRVCALVVKKLHPQARVQVEIAQPWGEYAGHNRDAVPPQLFAEAVSQTGPGVDALALSIEMGQTPPGAATRDLMALSDLIDRYAELDRPLAISALGAPSRPTPAAGAWRGEWSPERQAEWLERAMLICASKPCVQSVCWQSLSDAPGRPPAGLLDETGAPKPAMAKFAAFRQSIRDGRVPIVA